MCQQSIEKTFKALISHNGNEVLPVHNLRRLAESTGSINLLDEKQLVKLDFLSQYYINARYKEDITELSKGVTKEFSEDMINFTKEIVKWIMQKMK